MKTGTSYLVWAERFQLMELKSASNGTYNKEGRKESMGSKLVVRSWAVDRNINDNNELYKLAAAMVKALGNINAVPAKVEEVEEVDTLEDLKTIIKENDLGIRIAKGDSRAKVEAKIKEAQK